MDDKLNFKSEMHAISNYHFKFTRFNRPNKTDDFINQIDIYTTDNILIHTIKFDSYNARILYRVMRLLLVTGEEFTYEIPSFNVHEVYKISARNELEWIPSFIISIDNETINCTVNLTIKFTLEEYEQFMFLFYFMFLIDITQGESQDEI